MLDNSLVSVIIPCFNHEDYISETINSVLDQSYSNIELIVVDDGCTDGSRAILENYGSTISLLEHSGRVNKGQSAAINISLKSASGEFIAILDSDDLFCPTKIEKQVAYLTNHPDVGAVYSNGMNIKADGTPMYTLYPEGKQPIIGPDPVLENCAYNLPSNTLVRKSVFDKAGFLDESLRSAQDHDMAIRVAEVAPVGYINEVLWAYRRHDASISHTRTLERWINGFKILDAAVKRYPYPLKTRLRRRAVLHFRLGQCLLQQKSYIKGSYHLFAAGICDPLRSFGVLLGKENVSTPQS